MPYATLEEVWNVDLYPDEETELVKQSQPVEKYGYPNKIYEPNPTPMDIPRPQYSMKEHLSEFELEKKSELSMLPNSQYTRLIEELKGENKKLKDKIDELQKFNNKQQDKDSLFDVILYISTGVFVIFMMDNITSMGRRY
jgi:hypothetical protein